MSDSYSRCFLHLCARISTKPKKLEDRIDPFTMRRAIEDLLGEHAIKKLQFEIPKINATLILLDSKVLDDAAIMLVAIADRRIPDPTMLNTDTSDAKSVGAHDGYTWAYSAHLFLGFSRTGDNEFPVLLEVSPRLGTTAISTFLNKSFRRDPYSTKETGEDFWPQIHLRGEISKRLKTALETGKLIGVDLIQEEPANNLATGVPGYTTTRETLSIRRPRKRQLRNSLGTTSKVSLLTELLRKGRAEGYNKMRVLISAAGGANSSIVLPTSTDDAATALFIRKTTERFEKRLPSAHDEIDSTIEERGLALLSKKRKDL